jgi:hypothetical protein
VAFRETSLANNTAVGRSLGAVETADIDYRAVSPWAILAAVLGLATPLAWIHPLLWAVPALAVVVGAGALAQINHQSAGLIGRKAAWMGVLAGVVCGIAAPLSYAVHYIVAEREARRIGLLWFQYLQDNEPQKAQQLLEHPRKRLAPDDRIWDHLREDELSRERFDKFVRRPLIRTLLALDGRTKVRFYASEGSQSGKRLEVFHERFAVTWQDEQQPRTLLVRLDLHRVTDRLTGEVAWFVDPQNDVSTGPGLDVTPPAVPVAPPNQAPAPSGDAGNDRGRSGAGSNHELKPVVWRRTRNYNSRVAAGDRAPPLLNRAARAPVIHA